MAENKPDMINPNHYKGLPGLFDKNGQPAQAIDVIEAACSSYTNACIEAGMKDAPGISDLGNILKYALRVGKKKPDASYQSSQKEKNLEEADKIVWYAKRFSKKVSEYED